MRVTNARYTNNEIIIVGLFLFLFLCNALRAQRTAAERRTLVVVVVTYYPRTYATLDRPEAATAAASTSASLKTIRWYGGGRVTRINSPVL